MDKYIADINSLKKKKNAVVLAHCYQNIEIDEVADYVGDSLYLSQMAAKTDAKIIIFAGVYFMAQTAKILSPNKKVLLPRKESGCLMADMINLEQLRKFKAANPNITTVIKFDIKDPKHFLFICSFILLSIIQEFLQIVNVINLA